jgi:hypothetical protein
MFLYNLILSNPLQSNSSKTYQTGQANQKLALQQSAVDFTALGFGLLVCISKPEASTQLKSSNDLALDRLWRDLSVYIPEPYLMEHN